MNIQTIKTKVSPILESEGVVKAAVFGSYATGEAKKRSDTISPRKYPALISQ